VSRGKRSQGTTIGLVGL